MKQQQTCLQTRAYATGALLACLRCGLLVTLATQANALACTRASAVSQHKYTGQGTALQLNTGSQLAHNTRTNVWVQVQWDSKCSAAETSESAQRPRLREVLAVVLLQQVRDLGVLVLQRAAVDLGGVRRQHNLHRLRGARKASLQTGVSLTYYYWRSSVNEAGCDGDEGRLWRCV